MYWYVIRTLAGQEEKILVLLRDIFNNFEFIYPKKRLSWRKNGELIDIIKPLFRGYLFVSASKNNIKLLDSWLRINRIHAWILKIDKQITPISSEEVYFIKKLMSNGDVVEKSEILKIGEKATIVKGPLIGLEGIIEKYSKRDRRVRIKITISGVEKHVELEGIWLKVN